jgi:hypothetical protein
MFAPNYGSDKLLVVKLSLLIYIHHVAVSLKKKIDTRKWLFVRRVKTYLTLTLKKQRRHPWSGEYVVQWYCH